MEIEINNTAAVDDDLVQVKCTHPAARHLVPCHIRVKSPPSPSSTVVVLVNPDERLRFGQAAEKSATLTVPANGSWSPFEISGEVGSKALNDAVIQAHCKTKTGAVIAVKTVTVFWFDQAKIELKAGGSYSIVGNSYDIDVSLFRGDDRHAMNFAAQARIRPENVNCAAPQVKDLRIGIMQTVLSAESLMVFGDPVMVWNPSIPLGTPFEAKARGEQRTVLPRAGNDTNDQSEPLYDQRATALTPPFGCANGAIARKEDTPDLPIVHIWPRPAKTADGTDFGEIRYRLLKVVLKYKFRTWAVVFNTRSKDFCTLRQAQWSLNVDSTLPNQKAVPTGDAAPSNDPVTAERASLATNNQNTRVQWTGGVKFTKK